MGRCGTQGSLETQAHRDLQAFLVHVHSVYRAVLGDILNLLNCLLALRKMAHKKRRVSQHMMEERSLQIIRDTLPTEWVVRDYKPDYGIDIAVELFARIDGSESITETLGEWFFAQVKSVATTRINNLRVYPRYNIEKESLKEKKDEYTEIDVIPFQLDTDELLTVQSVGSGVPVLLLLVTLDTGNIYFVCLNDIIDKYILPNDPGFFEKESKVIHIPVQNQISKEEQSLVPLRFLSKRAKLYSAFTKFTYQEHEVGYLLDQLSMIPAEILHQAPALDILRHFLKIITRYDFWVTTKMWLPIQHTYQKVLRMQNILDVISETNSLPEETLLPKQLPLPESGWDREELTAFMLRGEIQSTWSMLKNLNNMYEEICREWFLPTYLAQLSSSPDIDKNKVR